MGRIEINLLLLYSSAAIKLSYIVGGVLWMLHDLLRRNDGRNPEERAPSLYRPSIFRNILFSASSISGVIICTWYIVHDQPVTAFILSVPLFILVRVFSFPGLRREEENTSNATEIIFLILAISMAAILRFYAIADYPPGMNEDEVKLSLEGGRLLTGHIGMLSFSHFGGVPNIIFAPYAVVQRFMAPSRVSFRLYEIFCGIMCIPAFYCIARCCLPVSIAKVATILLVFSPYHNFYSRVWGANLAIIEIASLYFLITALSRRSVCRMAFGAAGVALLQYNYIAARIMLFIFPLGILMAWIGRRVTAKRMIVSILVTIGVLTLMLLPIYYLWKRDPHGYYFHRIFETMPPLNELGTALRSCILMFHDARYGTDGFATQANSQCMCLPVLTMMLGGLLVSFTMCGMWPAAFIGVSFILSLLPSVFSSVAGNSHRTIMAVAFIYLLSGYGIWVFHQAIPLKARFLRRVLFAVIIGWGSIAGVKYFFNDMWRIAQHQLEGIWNASAVRLAEKANELSKQGYDVVISRPPDYWNYLSGDYWACGSWKAHFDMAFRPDNWLPENWNVDKKTVVLSRYIDGPVFNIMTSWAWPYRWREEYYPKGNVTLLIGTNDPVDRAGRLMVAPKPVAGLGDDKSGIRWDGSVMFARPYLVMLRDCTEDADISIDGELLKVGEPPVEYSAGLHDVRIFYSSAEDKQPGLPEPWFDLQLKNMRDSSEQAVRISPSMLYSIPVHGWIHKVYSDDPSSELLYSAVEPFIFYNGVYAGAHYPVRGGVIHEWESIINVRKGEAVPLNLSWQDGDADIYMDGVLSPKKPDARMVSCSLAEGEHTVLIRWRISGEWLLIMLKQSEHECHPYEFWHPPLKGKKTSRLAGMRSGTGLSPVSQRIDATISF